MTRAGAREREKVVLVSCNYHNEVLQTWWLKTTEIYPLTISETESPSSRCQQGHTPSEVSKGESFIASGCF